MANEIQYVGARYVPKFADPVNWQSGKSYEALTIVTYNNDSYTSKIPVPANVGNPAQNPNYWVLTGNYNGQVEQYRQDVLNLTNSVIISQPTDTNITELIKDAFTKGRNVVLDGKRYKVSPFNIPRNYSLVGNGSSLDIVNSSPTTWAITLGKETEPYSDCSNQWGLYNVTVSCESNSKGIKTYSRSVTISDVIVFLPLDTGVEIGLSNDYSSDTNIINVMVSSIAEIDCGFRSLGKDNTYIDCRTLNTKYGFIASGGDNFYACHPLSSFGHNSTVEGSIGFIADSGNSFVSCVCDNFATGISATRPYSYVNIKDLHIGTNPNKSEDSEPKLCGIKVDANAHVSLDGYQSDWRKDLDNLVCDIPDRYASFDYSNIKFPFVTQRKNDTDLCDIACFKQYGYANIHTYPYTAGEKVAIAQLPAVFNNLSVQNDFASFNADVLSNEYSVKGITGALNLNKPYLNSIGQVSAKTTCEIHVGVAELNGYRYLYVSYSHDYAPSLRVHLDGLSLEYVYEKINLDSATILEDHKVDITV